MRSVPCAIWHDLARRRPLLAQHSEAYTVGYSREND